MSFKNLKIMLCAGVIAFAGYVVGAGPVNPNDKGISLFGPKGNGYRSCWI